MKSSHVYWPSEQWWNRVEQIREGVLGDGLDGSLFQYWNAERMLVATNLPPLLIKFWKYDLKAQCLLGASKTVPHGKSRRPCIILYMPIRSPRKIALVAGGLLRMGRGATPLQVLHRVLNTVKRLATPGETGGGCMYCVFKVRVNKSFAQGEEHTRGQGREGSL